MDEKSKLYKSSQQLPDPFGPEWNYQNDIDLPNEEVASVVRSAYQHRLPYRYSRHDAVLRRYGPLANDAACQAFVAK